MSDFTETYQNLPTSIKNLVKYVVEQVQPNQVILFGSRARGDNRENSDFDIVVTGSIEPEKWTQLMVDLEEKKFSLYPVDLVQLKNLGHDYEKNIRSEGKIIYG